MHKEKKSRSSQLAPLSRIFSQCESPTGSLGVQVSYLESSFALDMASSAPWFSLSPNSAPMAPIFCSPMLAILPAALVSSKTYQRIKKGMHTNTRLIVPEVRGFSEK